MGVPASTFLDTYMDDMKKMKLMLLNYVKALQTKYSQPNIPVGISKAQHKLKLVLETTTEGYPILPIPLRSQN